MHTVLPYSGHYLTRSNIVVVIIITGIHDTHGYFTRPHVHVYLLLPEMTAYGTDCMCCSAVMCARVRLCIRESIPSVRSVLNPMGSSLMGFLRSFIRFPDFVLSSSSSFIVVVVELAVKAGRKGSRAAPCSRCESEHRMPPVSPLP